MRFRAPRRRLTRGSWYRAAALGFGGALVLGSAPTLALAFDSREGDPANESSAAAESIEPFLGTWILVPDADLEQSIYAGIDRSLSGMSAMTRFAARVVMRAQVGPPSRFLITLLDGDGSTLRIQTEDDEATDVDLNAPPRPYTTRDGEPVIRSARLREGALTVKWQRGDRSGGRVYEVSDGGATLKVQEIINSERFSVPLTFDALFAAARADLRRMER